MKAGEIALLKTFKSIKDNFRISAREVDVDNLAFKLHYRVTVVFLLSCTALVTTFQYFGGHIACIADKGVPEKVVNTFCFFSSTFTVVRHLNRSSVEAGSALQLGVGPAQPGEDDVVRHAYYQWVPFVLFAQALFFYAPHYVWKHAEGGVLKVFANGLENLQMAVGEKELNLKVGSVPSKEQREARLSTAGKAFVARRRLYGSWAGWLVACELLCAVNLVLQIAAVHAFLGGGFWDLVPAALDVDADAPRLDVVFPKMTKCTFRKFGPGGGIQTYDALCVLQLNLVNEKLFVSMWVWMTALLVATGLALAWRIGTAVLYGRWGGAGKAMMRSSWPGLLDDLVLDNVMSACNYPAWLFLCYLGGNVDARTFKDLLHSVAAELDDGFYVSNITAQETLPLNKTSPSSLADGSPKKTHDISS